MVPVRVRQQDLRPHRAVLVLHELPSQGADAGAGVEDHQLALARRGALHRHTRRVAAVARGVRSRGGDGAACPPEGHRVGHLYRQRRTLELSYGKCET